MIEITKQDGNEIWRCLVSPPLHDRFGTHYPLSMVSTIDNRQVDCGFSLTANGAEQRLRVDLYDGSPWRVLTLPPYRMTLYQVLDYVAGIVLAELAQGHISALPAVSLPH